ncbi:MAG TPA: 16S rRNA (adenine(1518)-N(6)/adenine(1519)-N(6))-dimethyltransferase RsmA [Clostridiaceae bacterium]|nr:16S rRNA (adenine(1518)-N(6)/adenine(1519)-N(6))-dimethyltransferase RsmA [Clostridiaceae bacterium]
MSNNVKEFMKKYNIRLTKSLGQNFLIDNNIVRKIVDSAQISEGDMVIEVGAGIGNMTSEIASRAGKVIAIEIDRRLIGALTENIKPFNNVQIINNDILKLDIKRDVLSAENTGSGGFVPENIKVVANLPYYITTPIIMKFLEEAEGINMLVLMVQKEVADRMVAKPGGKDYGVLSVAVQYYSTPERIFDVPPGCFVPPPDVHSTVIRLRINKEPPVKVDDKEMFFKVVKAAFGQRRKTLLNALSNSGYFNLDKEKIKQILNNLGISENLRGEALSITQFALLSNSFTREDC